MINDPGVDAIERETRRYYDIEEGREARPLDPRRIALRDRFVTRVGTSGRARRILEIGTGPGRDAIALAEAGVDVIGVDLSPGHAARAAARGVVVAAASARALPFTDGAFDALWSMSTLMHIPSAAIAAAMQEIARVLAPGATVAVGVWGGPDVEHYGDRAADGSGRPRRLFSRRSTVRWRALLETIGTIDDYEVWGDDEPEDFRYHVAWMTARS